MTITEPHIRHFTSKWLLSVGMDRHSVYFSFSMPHCGMDSQFTMAHTSWWILIFSRSLQKILVIKKPKIHLLVKVEETPQIKLRLLVNLFRNIKRIHRKGWIQYIVINPTLSRHLFHPSFLHSIQNFFRIFKPTHCLINVS